MSEQKIEQYSNSIKSLTYYISSVVIPKIWENDAYKEEPKWFFYTLLFKLNNGIDSVNILIRNVVEIPSVADSVFVLLRTLISDCIQLDYVLFNSNDDEEKLKIWIKSLYHDHVKFILSSLKIYSLFDGWDELKLKEVERAVKNKNPDYYDANGTIKSDIKNMTSINGICKIILTQKNDKEVLTDLRRLYPLYEKFSKYEHLGELSSELTHRAFVTDQKNEVLVEIQEAISILLRYQFWLITNFFKPDEIECSDYLNLMNEINSIRLFDKTY